MLTDLYYYEAPGLNPYRNQALGFSIAKVFRPIEEEMRKYRYNPKRLSFNLYGTTSYWWSIIFANQIHSLTEFDFSRDNVIKVFTREGISAFSTVLSVDKTFISENQSEVSKDRKSVTSMLQKQNAEEINASSI